MKKIFLLLFILSVLFVISFVSLAAESIILKSPLIATTCGQSPGALMVKLISQRAGLECDQEDLLTIEGLKAKPYQTIIITMGTSMKGMGAAGTDINAEVRRINTLIEEARKQEIVIIGAHIEGMARRVDKYDQISIETVANKADLIIVKADSDSDQYFTKLAEERNVPIYTVQETLDLQQLFEELFVLQ